MIFRRSLLIRLLTWLLIGSPVILTWSIPLPLSPGSRLPTAGLIPLSRLSPPCGIPWRRSLSRSLLSIQKCRRSSACWSLSGRSLVPGWLVASWGCCREPVPFSFRCCLCPADPAAGLPGCRLALASPRSGSVAVAYSLAAVAVCRSPVAVAYSLRFPFAVAVAVAPSVCASFPVAVAHPVAPFAVAVCRPAFAVAGSVPCSYSRAAGLSLRVSFGGCVGWGGGGCRINNHYNNTGLLYRRQVARRFPLCSAHPSLIQTVCSFGSFEGCSPLSGVG